MPVLGTPSTASGAGIIKPGVHLPAGWGSEWYPARNNSVNELVEAAWFGDSTTAGSTGSGASYSLIQRVRARLIAAGYTDGRKGLIGPADDLIDYTEPSGEVTGTLVQQFDGTYPIQSIIGGGTPMSSTAGQQWQMRGNGTMIRLFYVRHASSGDFTYSIDGGAAVTVTTNAAAGSYRSIDSLAVTGLSDGLHTLTITNLGGRNSSTTLDTATPHVAVLASIQRHYGIVMHKVARGGARTLDFFDPQTENGGWSNVLWRPLLALGLATTAVATPSTAFDGGTLGLQQSEDTHPAHPRSRLAVLHLGFNDLTNMVDATTASAVYDRVTTTVAAFCRMAKSAGASPLVLSGQFPANGQYRKYGGRVSAGVREAAVANGAAWVDVVTPLGTQWGSNPHLSIAQYQAQGDFIWDNVLGL